MQKREVTKKQLSFRDQRLMRGVESGPVNGAKSFTMVAPLVLLDAVCAAWQIFIRHFLRMKVRRLICTGMQKK